MKSATPALPSLGSHRLRATLRSQRGQALIYGLFVLTGGLTALFFLFNAGQLSAEKTKLVNTADAVAYSASVMHARTLNFQAYTNRAIVANTVAIAQLVSLSSWVKYVNSTAEYGMALGNWAKYPQFSSQYLLMRSQTASFHYMSGEINPLEALATTSDKFVKTLAQTSALAHVTSLAAGLNVMHDVAKFNYLNDGVVEVMPLPSTLAAYGEFVTGYEGHKRTRLAEVVERSAKRDSFVRRRSWLSPATYSDCPSAKLAGRPDWIDRRGGTELIGFDEWKAMDTISEKKWHPRSKYDLLCRGLGETPSGWAVQSASNSETIDLNPFHFDSSPLVNPAASGLAVANSSSSWGYSGLPGFYDLSSSALAEEDPRLKVSVILRRPVAQTRTSEGRSTIASTPRLNAYQAKPANGSGLIAVSAAEAFFERPDIQGERCGDGMEVKQRNCYGKDKFSKPREIGSLFNPYWQARLIDASHYLPEAIAFEGVIGL